MTRDRGFTVAELLVVLLIVVMLLTAVAAALLPLFHASGAAGAKYDALAPAASGLYVIERDIRQSDAGGDFSCSIKPVSCFDGLTQPGDEALAIATFDRSGDLSAPYKLDDTTGSPYWLGFIVYWRPADSTAVYRTYESEPDMEALMTSGDRVGLQALAASAVFSAIDGHTGVGPSGGGRGPGVAMLGVSSFMATIDISGRDVDLRITTIGMDGDRSNTSMFDTDVLTRN